ncbi:hypothetical protein FC96_GL002203 [Secundilactobacillus kimchicus JCM 15530]|uniref:Uncharacterized protein n=1 Tax=Secundilactobacillus kimchicus JCM 15530 TaxID=1302272 RepID=A0A0R1HMI5_9LACO|nr:hypothetical protein FC96_GL002203 [Secundilactobacillus kimchicus JCM 15530]
MVFHKLVNIFVFFWNLVILFVPSLDSRFLNLFSYLVTQMFKDGDIQADVISLMFVSLTILAFLFEHLSRAASQLIDPQIAFSSKYFNLLITKRFLNIYTLYSSRKNGGLDSRIDFQSIVNDSIVTIFSKSDPMSDMQRQLSVNQDRYRFIIEYMATFKLLFMIGIIELVISIFTLDWLQLSFSLAGIIVFATMWYVSAILAYSVVWRLLDRYWGGFKITQIADNSVLHRDYIKRLDTANASLFEPDIVLMVKDFVGLQIRFQRAELLGIWWYKLVNFFKNCAKK